MWIGYEDTDRKISYPYAHNLSVCVQPIRMRTTYPRVAEEGDNDGYGVGTLYPGRAPSRYARLSMDLTLQCAAGPDRWQPTCEPSKELRRWGGPKCAAITPRPNPCEPPSQPSATTGVPSPPATTSTPGHQLDRRLLQPPPQPHQPRRQIPIE